MKLIVDIGNTNILLALHNGVEWEYKFRYETKGNQPELFFEVGLRDLLLEWGVLPSDITMVGVSSVVPEMNDRIINALRLNTRVEPQLLSPQVFLDMDMTIPRPYEIGADLVANAYSALRKYGKDSIVVDFGTALTFTLVKKEAGIVGVTIAPGIHTALKALTSNTALLPMVDGSMPDSVIGTDTESAINGGVYYGYVGLVKEIINKIKEEDSADCFVIATGGLSEVLSPLKEVFDVVDRELTIDGIRFILENELNG